MVPSPIVTMTGSSRSPRRPLNIGVAGSLQETELRVGTRKKPFDGKASPYWFGRAVQTLALVWRATVAMLI
jgi:hypothetical protein